MLRSLGSSIRRKTEDLSTRLSELPITDVSSLQSFVQGKDHPQLFLEDSQLQVALDELESARDGIKSLLAAMNAYRDAMEASSVSAKALGETVSTATASLESEEDDEEKTRAQIQLGAALIVTAGENGRAVKRMCEEVERKADEIEKHYESVVKELKKRYVLKKVEYLRIKSQISAKSEKVGGVGSGSGGALVGDEAHDEFEQLLVKERASKSEWMLLSGQLKKEAEELSAALASAISKAVLDVGQCRAEILSRNANAFSSLSSSADPTST